MRSMANQAILVDHRLAVRLMAIETGHRLAVLRMTLGTTTELFFMSSPGRGESGHRLGVADGTGSGRHIRLNFRGGRRMRRMTILAILVAHRRGMRLVTVEAGLGIAMFRLMAGVAFQLGVGTGSFLHLLPRSRMAGDTGSPNILHLRNRFGQRRMGSVTGSTAFHGIMGFALGIVTVGTSGQTPRLRRMLRVAFTAVAHVSVGSAALLDFLNYLIMTTRTKIR
jgi:hypothetical protein